jgi:hypothetical protein
LSAFRFPKGIIIGLAEKYISERIEEKSEIITSFGYFISMAANSVMLISLSNKILYKKKVV